MIYIAATLLAAFVLGCVYCEILDRYCIAHDRDLNGADRPSPREVMRWVFRRMRK